METAHETIEAKAFRTFIRIYSLLKSERLSTNIKLTLHKALMLVPPANSDSKHKRPAHRVNSS
jgi:hypothetical protein